MANCGWESLYVQWDNRSSRGPAHSDLEINFDYNSAVVGPQAVSVLVTLGRVLSQDEFRDTVFLINGHTDAKGGLEFNQDLSERRAEAVKQLLVKQFNLPASTLIAVGYGKAQLKHTTDPFAGENRRVQIVNTEVK
jgi:outer membrane protein OmpA-like peptidoglycan-associated protein